MTTAALSGADVRLRHSALRELDGDSGVEAAPMPGQRDVRRRIVQSLHRNADLDARHIQVAVTDDVVTLTGTVSSWSQYEAAERAAGSSPGIRLVANQIHIAPPEYEFEPPDEIC